MLCGLFAIPVISAFLEAVSFDNGEGENRFKYNDCWVAGKILGDFICMFTFTKGLGHYYFLLKIYSNVRTSAAESTAESAACVWLNTAYFKKG